MISYLFKWLLASLIMPVAVMLFGPLINQFLVLVFWPGSIVLMSLGGSEQSLSQVIYVWGTGIGLNVVLYIFIGFVGLGVLKLMSK